MACQYWVDQLVKDQDKAVFDRRQELKEQELERFMETAIGNKSREQQGWINFS